VVGQRVVADGGIHTGIADVQAGVGFGGSAAGDRQVVVGAVGNDAQAGAAAPSQGNVDPTHREDYVHRSPDGDCGWGSDDSGSIVDYEYGAGGADELPRHGEQLQRIVAAGEGVARALDRCRVAGADTEVVQVQTGVVVGQRVVANRGVHTSVADAQAGV